MDPKALVMEPPIVTDPRTLPVEPRLAWSQALKVDPAVKLAVIDVDDPKQT